MIVSADGAGTLKLWDAATGQLLGTLLGHTDKIWSISVSPDGKTLATSSSDGTVKLWGPRPPRPDRSIPPLTAPRHGSMQFTFTPDGKLVIVARAIGGDFEVEGFDPNTGVSRFHHVLIRGEPVHGFMLISGGEFVILHSSDGSAAWETATGKRRARLGRFNYVCEAWHQRLIVSRDPSRPHELVDAATGETSLVLPPSGYLASSPKGEVIALLHHGELLMWDVATNRIAIRRILDLPPDVVAFSPDGMILAIGSGNGVIQMRDTKTLEPRGTPLLSHSNAIRHLHFAPDGRTLISDSTDGTERLWDVRTGEELFALRWPNGVTLSQPRFSPDGRTLGFCAEGADGSWLYLLSTALPGGIDSGEGP